MKVATATQMREIDRKATAEYGLPGIALMENAGAAVAKQVCELLGEACDKRVCIFAGKGNNGGDGFVAARHLALHQAKVNVFLVGPRNAVGGDARVNLEILLAMGFEIVEINGERDWDKAKFAAAFADCLVDALVGTGFRGELSGDLAEVARIMNAAGKPVVAVDIPSGVEADTGQVLGCAVQAQATVTLALPKPGLYFQPGASHVGKLTVDPIGMPAALLQDEALQQNAILAGHVRNILPRRQPGVHKGSNGRVTVVAGSVGFTGAAALAANAAVRAGAGLVTLGVAANLYSIMAVKLTEVMTKPLADNGAGALGAGAADEIAALMATSDVLALGPGLGREEVVRDVIRRVIREASRPLVIDADGLNALVGYTDLLLESDALAVLTPHPGELSRLTGLPVPVINADRLAAAREAAGRWGAIVVLKGPGTVVAFPDGEVYINTTGNAAMATGGTGDVLTGVIAALIAQGLSSHDAAVAGVYLHGLAGDIAAGEGGIGLAAGDLLTALPQAFAVIFESDSRQDG